MITLAAIFILTACFIYYYWDAYSYWKRKGVVGPTPWPIVGNYGQVLFRLKPEIKRILEIYDQYPQEKYVGFYIGSRPALLLRDVSIFRQVFGKDYKDFPTKPISVASSPFEESVFVMRTGEKWKNYRQRFINVSKNTEMAKTMSNIEVASIDFLVFLDKLVATNPEQDVVNLLQRCFTGVANKAVLGRNIEHYEKDTDLQINASFTEQLETDELSYIFEAIFPGVVNIFKKIFIAIGESWILPCIKIASAAMNARKHVNQNETFVDLLLELQENKNKANEWEINDEAMRLHIAAMTVGLIASGSLVASFVAFALAKNPDIQNKCYEEISQVLERTDGKMTLETLTEMKYFDMVIEETLRMYGLSYTFQRISGVKYNFPNTDLIIDPGVRIMSSPEVFRRNPKYFPDPDKFIPERFTPENREKIPLGVHTPFGYGPRHCIGKPVAKLVLMMTMAALLLRFKLEPSDLTKELKYAPSHRSRKPLGRKIWINIISRRK